MKYFPVFLLAVICMINLSFAQSGNKSIMQKQNEFYSQFNLTAEKQWDSLDAVLHPWYKASSYAETIFSAAR